ncbi:hypothetical protein [Sphingobacterium litopenaei]|nr:hypothetical protein [Sphingobacterium litopenaei]
MDITWDIGQDGLLIERKNNSSEVWEIINHLQKHLIPPMKNGIYPKTKPGKREGHRIELTHLGNWDDGTGLINILLFPADWELLYKVEMIIDEALTDELHLKLTIDRKSSEVPGHIRVKYEYTKL